MLIPPAIVVPFYYPLTNSLVLFSNCVQNAAFSSFFFSPNELDGPPQLSAVGMQKRTIFGYSLQLLGGVRLTP
jgi:hypothetical protein